MRKVFGWVWRLIRHHPRITLLTILGSVLSFLVILFLVDSVTYDSVDGSFERSLNPSEMSQLLRMFSVVMATLEAANVTYFMNGGTLLGSYRHHGPIPWDDDIDLMVSSHDKPVAHKVLTKLQPDYQLYVYRNDIGLPWTWRLYPTDGSSMGFHTWWFGWRFPLLDLLFYSENSTHVWGDTYDNEVWLKSTVFPLRRRPFAHLWVPAPCDVVTHLAVDYADLTECQTTKISHRTFRAKKQVHTVNCTQLQAAFPFVHRTRAAGSDYVVESLKLYGDARDGSKVVVNGSSYESTGSVREIVLEANCNTNRSL
jgi:hypothetical protein